MVVVAPVEAVAEGGAEQREQPDMRELVQQQRAAGAVDAFAWTASPDDLASCEAASGAAASSGAGSSSERKMALVRSPLWRTPVDPVQTHEARR